jgi:hypothetical protein
MASSHDAMCAHFRLIPHWKPPPLAGSTTGVEAALALLMPLRRAAPRASPRAP